MSQSGRILEFSKRILAARTGRGVTRDTYPPGRIDPVVMAGERGSQKIQQGKKTKVTTANQNGNRFRTEGPAPSQEHLVIEA